MAGSRCCQERTIQLGRVTAAYPLSPWLLLDADQSPDSHKDPCSSSMEPTRHHLPSGRYLLPSISSYQSGTLPCSHFVLCRGYAGVCVWVGVGVFAYIYIYISIYIYCVYIYIYLYNMYIYIYNMYIYTMYIYIYYMYIYNVYIHNMYIYIYNVYIYNVYIYNMYIIYICNMYIYIYIQFIIIFTYLHGWARLKFDTDRYHLYNIPTLELPSRIQKKGRQQTWPTKFDISWQRILYPMWVFCWSKSIKIVSLNLKFYSTIHP